MSTDKETMDQMVNLFEKMAEDMPRKIRECRQDKDAELKSQFKT